MVMDIDHLFALAAHHGQVISEIKLGDLHMIMQPKDLPEKLEKDAPKELPDDFDKLPVPDNWLDPGDRPDTDENRKRAMIAQDAADKEALGGNIPNPDQ